MVSLCLFLTVFDLNRLFEMLLSMIECWVELTKGALLIHNHLPQFCFFSKKRFPMTDEGVAVAVLIIK